MNFFFHFLLTFLTFRTVVDGLGLEGQCPPVHSIAVADGERLAVYVHEQVLLCAHARMTYPWQ